MKFNPDIHHRRSIRLQGYDYSASGVYFVTICVQGRECLLGAIEKGEMDLNEAGSSVQAVWQTLCWPACKNDPLLGVIGVQN